MSAGWNDADEGISPGPFEASNPAIVANGDTVPDVAGLSLAEPVPEDPRHADWIAQHGATAIRPYNYAELNMTEAEHRAAQGDAPALTPGDVLQDHGWANNATVYEWLDEYGDVGPAHPVLERQLFGSDVHVVSGVDFSNIAMIRVFQEGSVRIKPVRDFKDAGLHPVMFDNVVLAGYKVPTPVQAFTLGAIYNGYDMVACAQTGSGKTAAYLIPTLSKLMGKAKKLCAPRPNPATYVPDRDNFFRAEPLILVVCPNRELAVQIFNEARRFCYRSMLRPCVVYGGGPRRDQLDQIAKGCDVLIGTPGRLVDFITNEPGRLSLCRLKYMIIDEADEMLQSDWETELEIIMTGGDQEVGNIIYMMFSATFPKSLRDIAKQHLSKDFCRFRVGRAGSSHVNIEQNVIFVEPSAKRRALLDLLYSRPPARTMVFVNNKRTADEIDDYLYNIGLPSTSIHSDRTQREREDAIRAFRIGEVAILVATGVSARGLDIKNVMHVINYDLPSATYGGIEEYTHRIGRTGRIGNRGLASSFYFSKNEDIASDLVKTLLETEQKVPDFLEEFIPEGGAENLKFDADSDDEFLNSDNDDNGGEGPSKVEAQVLAPEDYLILDYAAPQGFTPVPRPLPGMGAGNGPVTLPGMGPAVAKAPMTLPGMGPAAMKPAVVAPVAVAPAPFATGDKGKGKAVDPPTPAISIRPAAFVANDDDDAW